MPAPDDPSGGGPWSSLYLPNPDDNAPGTPRSRSAARAIVDLTNATRAVMRRT